MIHISNLQDLSIIQNDPELYREVASYILYCRFEMLEDEHIRFLRVLSTMLDIQ